MRLEVTTEDYYHLGCHTMLFGGYISKFQNNPSTLKMEAAGYSTTSVMVWQNTRRHIQKDNSLHRLEVLGGTAL